MGSSSRSTASDATQDEPLPIEWRPLVALFFGGWALIYANRTGLSAILTLLESQWTVSKADLGLLGSAFFLAYAVMQIPSGILADRIGRRLVLLAGYWVHGLGALLGAGAPSFALMLGARALTGLGQGTYYASQFALATEALPPARRSFGLAVINTGMAVGTAIGWALSSLVIYGVGWSWRASMLLLALGTVAMASLLTAKVPAPGRPPAAAERAPGRLHPQPRAPVPWRQLVRPQALLAYVVMFSSMYAFFVFLTWLPYYLQMTRGVSDELAGVIAALMPLVAVPGGLGAGYLADRLGRRRPILLTLFLLAAVAIWAIVFIPGTPGLVLGVLLYGISGKLVGEPLLIRLVADGNGSQGALATLLGTLNFTGALAMVVAPWLTGLLADLSGSFTSGFLVAAGLQIVGFLALLGVTER